MRNKLQLILVLALALVVMTGVAIASIPNGSYNSYIAGNFSEVTFTSITGMDSNVDELFTVSFLFADGNYLTSRDDSEFNTRVCGAGGIYYNPMWGVSYQTLGYHYVKNNGAEIERASQSGTWAWF